MTKAEYIVTKNYCNIKCTPSDKCKNCNILKMYKEIYGSKILSYV